MLQPFGDVMREGGGALALRRHHRSGAVGVGQPGVGAAKGELAEQAGLAGEGIGIERAVRIGPVAIERDDIDMASGGFDHAARGRKGESAAEHEMIGIGGLDGGDRQREIAIRQQPDEGRAVGGGGIAVMALAQPVGSRRCGRVWRATA